MKTRATAQIKPPDICLCDERKLIHIKVACWFPINVTLGKCLLSDASKGVVQRLWDIDIIEDNTPPGQLAESVGTELQFFSVATQLPDYLHTTM